jgi:hypothetical protein
MSDQCERTLFCPPLLLEKSLFSDLFRSAVPLQYFRCLNNVFDSSIAN